MRSILATFILVALSATAGLAADVKTGQAAYDKACKSCHGVDGTPNPSIVKMMKVEMKDLKSADVQTQSNDALKKIITEGKGKMKPVKTVSGAAIDDVIAYVRSLKK